MNLNDLNVAKELKIVYMGTPTFSAVVLKDLLQKYKIRAVVTQPDRKFDRDHELVISPVKKIAIENTILVLQPENLKNSYQEIINLEPDLIITCAYGQIVPKELLNYPRLGCINVHASLLPKLRGGAPIQRAIMEGFTKTGITIMKMAPSMDTGDIIYQEEIAINKDDTGSTLHDKLATLASSLLIKSLPSIIDQKAPQIKQDDSLATYGFTIKSEDERIVFDKTKKQVYDLVRALNSHPGAYCFYKGKRLKVFKCYETDNIFTGGYNGQITKIYDDGFGVKVSNGEVVFTEVQPEGKNRMAASEFIKGINDKDQFIGRILD